MARKYQHTQELLPKIKEMLEGGMTQREVAERLGVTGERAIHHLLTRERKKELHGIPKQRGRKPAKALAEYKYENKRLKMEVELLRDFLLLTGKPCMPIQCCQVYYSRTTDSNIFLLICGNKILIICFSCPIIFHQYFICFIRLYRCQNRSRCQHNCLSALQLQRANFVNSRFKIQYFRIFWIINILKFRPENCQRMLIAFIYLNHQIGRLCISKMNFVFLHCCSNM